MSYRVIVDQELSNVLYNKTLFYQDKFSSGKEDFFHRISETLGHIEVTFLLTIP